jgi:hypothetical protein
MKVLKGLLLSSAAGVLLVGVSAMPRAMAADADMPVKAAPLPATTGWTWEGYAELGARFFVNKNGGTTGINFTNQNPSTQSLGKFYEYRDLRSGLIGDVGISGLSNNGLYSFNFGTFNPGYRDQAYFLDWSKAGEHYLSLSYDQIPHIYNNEAGTLYNGTGTNNLTIPNSVRATLAGQLNAAIPPVPPNATAAGNIANAIESNLNRFVLGFKRETGDVNYRWTPTTNWDIKADYNVTRREGTQPQGALTYQFGTNTPSSTQERNGRVILELPKPVADTTHNADLNAEYAGTSPWGKKYNVALGYGFSAYQNDNSSYSFQNPFVTDGLGNTPGAPLTNTMSLAPDNTANTIHFVAGADLPWKSRYNGAVNYTATRQDQTFVPYTSNTSLNAGNVCITGNTTCVPTGVFPFLSNTSGLGNNTLLINNVLTTQLTSDLKSTLRYRYYDFSSTQNAITTNAWIYADAANAAEDSRTSYGVSYNKQNASADLVWHPKRYLNIGAGVGWERWDRDHRDVNVTNEYLEKVFADLQAFEWALVRASYTASQRRFDGQYVDVVESNVGNGYTNYMLFDMANRDRNVGKFYIDFSLPGSVTLTPTGGFTYDDYGTNPYIGQMGLLNSRAWDVGIEAAWKPVRGVTFLASYTHEEAHRDINAANSTTSGLDVQTRDNTDTFIVGVKAAVTEKLDVKATYTAVHSFGGLAAGPGPGTPVAAPSPTAFRDVTTNYSQVDITARYMLDPIRQAGVVFTPYLKVRYLWERNSTNDWQPLSWNYMYNFAGQTGPTFAKGIMLGWDNPNYNVNVLMLSAGVKW